MTSNFSIIPTPERRIGGVISPRWILIAVIMLAASLNYLDRQLLSAFAPTIKQEFHITNTVYGEVVGAFALATMLAVPLMGLVIDHIGLRIGVSAAVAFWSIFGAVTALVRSLGMLIGVRVGLAVGESALSPSSGKAGALYLDPAELGVASGFGAAAVTLGTSSAPILAATLGPILGWRGVFIATGLLGFVWVAVWLLISRIVPPRKEALERPPLPYRQLLRDKRLWGISATWALVLSNFGVWSSWMTIFLVQNHHLNEVAANKNYAWIPPVFSILGGFVGGGWVFRKIRKGYDPLASRLTNTWWMALLLPATMLAPWMPTPTLAVAMIGISYLGSFAITGNTHIMPVDLYGAPHAGVANSISAGLYSLFQAALGPLMGFVVDHYGFRVGFAGVGLLSLSGILILRISVPRTPERGQLKTVAALTHG